jgi:hypothetical protein
MEEKVLKEVLAYRYFGIRDIGGPEDKQLGHSTSKFPKR